MDRISAQPQPTELLSQASDERDAGRLREAEATCRRVLEIDTDCADAHRMLGTILREQGEDEAALASFSAATRLDPASAPAHKHLSISLADAGRLSEAIDAARTALQLRPGYASVLCHLADLKTISSRQDPDLQELEALAHSTDELPDDDSVHVFFALAKAYSDLGDYQRSFACLTRANALRRRTVDYDSSAEIGFLRQIAHVFDEGLFEHFAGAGSASEAPILIVGMPRSGTTLVEQILASHPHVHGAGELRDLQELSAAVSVLTDDGLGFPHDMPRLSRQDLTRLGHAYTQRLCRRAPDAARIIDKNPLNFRYVGLARLIVPHARIIHCTRDPLDTCVSCFILDFRGVDFSYDLHELGQYYRAYEQLMAHWRRVLPLGSVLDVRYEQLVDDVESETRRLLSHCGLDWDDACLSFYSNERHVRTASYAQVRQPVYRNSVGRWRRYESHLGPLLAALGCDQPS